MQEKLEKDIENLIFKRFFCAENCIVFMAYKKQ